MNHEVVANKILESVGGKNNITYATFCMTRLRLSLKDNGLINDDNVRGIDGVIGTKTVGTQYQIIIGPDVEYVYKCFCKTAKLEEAKRIEENLDVSILEKNSSSQKSFGRKMIDVISLGVTTLSNIFTPLIPAMLGAGLIKVIMILLDKGFGINADNSTTYAILNILQNSFFYYMPVMVGWSAAKKFNANTVLSLMLIGLLIHPNLAALFENGNVTFIGLPVTKVTYTTSIIPAIFAVYFEAKVQNLLKKIVPNMLKSIFVPLLTLLITAPIVLIVLGPLGYWGGLAMTKIVTAFYDFSPALSSALIGGTWNLMLVAGMHMVILGLVRNPNIATFGIDKITVAYAASLMCQVAAGLAVAIRTKDPALKKEAYSLSLTSFFAGMVIEPVMYGINIKYKKPFLFTIIGGAIGGAIICACGAGVTAPVAFSIYTLPAYFGQGFAGLAAGSLIGAFITFILTYKFGLDDSAINGTNTQKE